MRGKVAEENFTTKFKGITPAYAGKSRTIKSIFPNHGDHPRLCGEKHHRPTLLVERIGSPPPMRGKVLVHMLLFQYHGITPAYAGKSLTEKQKDVFGKDHPRLCGEKLASNSFRIFAVGSPPPMRGKGKRNKRIFWGIGITPAYAGKR